MKKQNIGTMFDSWLREEGVYEQVSANAIKRILARQDDKIFGFLEGKRRIVGDVENTIPASDWKRLTPGCVGPTPGMRGGGRSN